MGTPYTRPEGLINPPSAPVSLVLQPLNEAVSFNTTTRKFGRPSFLVLAEAVLVLGGKDIESPARVWRSRFSGPSCSSLWNQSGAQMKDDAGRGLKWKSIRWQNGTTYGLCSLILWPSPSSTSLAMSKHFVRRLFTTCSIVPLCECGAHMWSLAVLSPRPCPCHV